MKKILLLLLLAFSFSSCEKDDICDAATPTTPRLVIEFYDVFNPDEIRTISLRLVSPGFGNLDLSGSKIQVPLKTMEDSTTFSFILGGSDNDTTNDNTDIVQLNYSKNTVFVSRACGYKTTFLLNNPNGLVRTDGATPDGQWIQSYSVQTLNIETENEVHVKMYL